MTAASMRAILSAVGVALLMGASAFTQEPLSLVQSITLPQVEGRIDHLAFDAMSNRLFVAALGNNTVEVLDLNAGAHLKRLPGFREPQGIAALADARMIAVANGQGEGLQLLNADDLRLGQFAWATTPTTCAMTRRQNVSTWAMAPGRSRRSTQQTERQAAKQSYPAIRNHSSSSSLAHDSL